MIILFVSGITGVSFGWLVARQIIKDRSFTCILDDHMLYCQTVAFFYGVLNLMLALFLF